MTREETKRLLPIIQAFADGKTIETQDTNGVWQAENDPSWIWWRSYRIKPETKRVPLTQEDVRDCVFQEKEHTSEHWPYKVSESGIYLLALNKERNIICVSYTVLMNEWLRRKIGTTEWLPCWKEAEE